MRIAVQAKYIMKIRASFDSPDSADHAAGALKRALSPLASIETRDIRPKQTVNGMNVFASFNTLSGTTPTYSMPIYNAAYINTANGSERDNIGSDHILEVVCRHDEESQATRIIIGYGGRNISKL